MNWENSIEALSSLILQQQDNNQIRYKFSCLMNSYVLAIYPRVV